MDGAFNGYLPYNQQQPPQQSQAQQPSQPQSSLTAYGAHHDSPSHTTLPPLQAQNGYSQFGNMSYPHPASQSHTPTTPHTPATSSIAGNGTSAYMSPNHGPHGMLPPASFNSPYHSSISQSMYPSSTATANASTTSSVGLPTLRPMPTNGMSGLPSMSVAGQMGQQTSFMQSEEAPTHVVGSQGRRGILPSAPGRPNPPPQGSAASTKSMIPQKDADGKYPCPHCNKTYLHAKHLKRHLLRHTGDRPYMCHLCKDTFSRSDILKRHFQKCSIRRGNPTGANHLAHQRRNTNNNNNRLSISQQDSPIGLAGLSEVAGANYGNTMVNSSPNVNGDLSSRSSRANSLIAPGNLSNRNRISGLGIAGGEQMTSAAYQPGMAAYAMQNAANGNQIPSGYGFNPSMYSNQPQPQQMSFLGQTSSRFNNSHSNSPQHTPTAEANGSQIDWNRMFNASGQDGFAGGQPANASSDLKPEPDEKSNLNVQNDSTNESFLGNLYSHTGALSGEYSENEQGIPGFPMWSTEDPLQAKTEALAQFCFPRGSDMNNSPAAGLLKACLTVENVKHFAEYYTSFQGHWPILHPPTFRITDANNGLVLAMLCIGAVYSPKMDVNQVRQMMELVRTIVFSSSHVFNRTLRDDTNGLGNYPWEVEEMQALLMIQTLFMWHGSPEQREIARQEHPTVARVAKEMGLCETAGPGHYAYSALHSGQNSQLQDSNTNGFNWHSWVEQEKRNRAMYLIYLNDAVMVIYFNCVPQFDPLAMRLMLPSDDASWDATNSQECANALGLNGTQAQYKNVNGTRKAKQPGVREALRTVLEPTAAFQPGATNAYSKFILIHSLIVRIIACQKTLQQPEGPFQGMNFGQIGSGPATPMSQNEWIDQHGSGGSLPNSGQATPTDCFGPSIQTVAAQKEKKILGHALDKWKRAWDSDMELQYPANNTQLRRFGFSRDAVHFFYLGRSLLQSQRANDWIAPAEVRFLQIISLLKRIKGFVVGDNETKGQEIGSVGDIDDQYGVNGPTVDMKLFFKPYNSHIDRHVASVRTHSL
ncbi:Hypothetical protein R9X50_00265200 [Acrodontium crateriforme]|uniref:C2H2-type domain-containing protein n=1 Tax=Acrodontium crateriforme TaxID=150365 RepID=A0AAQ3RB59_9PEZI|nr:Hypothetical protein R9X50_00265200 [Acrodontium crateriforme]